MASDISVELVDLSDLGTPIETLPLTRDRQWQETLCDTGSGSVTFQNDDPALASVVTPNTLANFYIDATLAFTMLAEQFEATLISQSEEAEQVTTWRGRGHSAVLDRAVLFPSLGVGRLPVEEDRSFNIFAIAYDDSDLVGATAVMTVGDAKAAGGTPWGGGFIPWDEDFPDDTAEILWGSFISNPSLAAVGTVYGRQWITTTFSGEHVLFVAADDGAEVYIDGALTVTTLGGTGHKMVYANVDLSAGTHLVAWVCKNLPFIASQNYAGIAWVLYLPGYPPPLVAHSLASDTLIADYPPDVPGMTPGATILIALAEAQARGTIPYVTTTTFDADLDSWGNAWPVVPDIATKVGTSVLTFLKELSGTYIDWRMLPGSWDLEVYNIGTMTAQPGVSYHAPTDPDDPLSGNLVEYHRRGEANVTDDALVRWEGGWAERGDAAAISADGRIEALLGLGALNSLSEVYRVADGQLDEFARERAQTDIAIAPVDNTDTPYLAFVVGDEIDVEGDAHRVLGMTVTEEADTGRAIFTPTLNSDVVLGFEERTFQAIRKMINGTFGGRSKVAQPVVHVFVPRGLLGGSGECVCNETTMVIPGPWVATNNGQASANSVDLCTNDMRVEVTVVTFTATPGNAVTITVRQDPLSAFNYSFNIEANNPATDATWELVANGIGVIASTVTTLPAPGDVLELEVQGTSLIASRNGTPMFTETDSDVVTGDGAYLVIGSGGALGTVEVEDFTVETFCEGLPPI